MNYSKIAIAAAFSVLAVAANAQQKPKADPHVQIDIIDNPGNFQNDENVLFQGPIDQGATVVGITNQSQYLVDFYNAGEELIGEQGNGQARVQGTDGDFTRMTIAPHDRSLSFKTLIINLDAMANGQVTFDVHKASGGMYTETFNVRSSGENWFRIIANNDQAISSVDLRSTVQLDDLKQPRVSFSQAPVPEPATMAALGLGLIGVARRRRSKKS